MQQTEGWLGKLLASQLDSQGHPLTGCALGQASTPSELLAQNATVSVIDSIPTYQVQGGAGRRVAAPALYKKTPGIYGALFDQALTTAEYGIAALGDSQSRYTPSVSYTPQSTVYGSKNSLATSLQLTAEMIVTQPSVKICHVVLGGFDTHQDEDTRQNALLAYVDSAVSAFMQDIANHGMADRVVLMTWSEFGRRVVENGGKGTDHGAAAPIFVVGKPVKGGVFGEQPSLTKTVNSGNLQYNVDFRSVYQTLIRDWLRRIRPPCSARRSPSSRSFRRPSRDPQHARAQGVQRRGCCRRVRCQRRAGRQRSQARHRAAAPAGERLVVERRRRW